MLEQEASQGNIATKCELSGQDDDPTNRGMHGRIILFNPEDVTTYWYLGVDEIKLLEFSSLEEAEDFYKMYAISMGFDVRRQDNRRVKDGTLSMQKWVCNRAGIHTDVDGQTSKAYHRSTKKVDCQARLRVLLHRDGKWKVKEIITEHSHELVAPKHSFLLKGNRRIPSAERARIDILHETGIKTSQIMEHLVNLAGGYDRVGFTKRDLYNYIQYQREQYIKVGDTTSVVAYLTSKFEADPAFFYRIDQVDGRLSRLMWADSRGRVDFQCFGDVIAFDSTYRTNVYNMPFVVITGINYHHQSCIFASALLVDETTESYCWVLQNFMEAMNGKQPLSVITDGARSMHAAITQVWPHVPHRLCAWHLERNCVSNIRNKQFLTELRKCMYNPMSITEFDETWAEAVRRHDLHGDAWLELMHKSRLSWAEAFLRGHFWGGMRTTQRCESMHALMKRFLTKRFRLYEFIEGFNRALDTLRHQETLADYHNIHTDPPLQTALKRIESHVANVFTRASYKKICTQIINEALWYTIDRTDGDGYRKYRLCQYGNTTRTKDVVFKTHDPSINCSCLEFETNGLPCCHAIHIAKIEELTEIPFNLIMTRWTKRARELSNRAGPSRGAEGSTIGWKTRYGALTNICNQLCYLASQTEEGYDEVAREVTHLTVKMQHMIAGDDGCSGNSTQLPHLIQDPIRMRKVGTTPRRARKLSTPRKCSHCHRTGHTKRTCPDILTNIDTLGAKKPMEQENCSDEDMAATLGQENFLFAGETSMAMDRWGVNTHMVTPPMHGQPMHLYDASSHNWSIDWHW